jgi:excinuclease ABC subunit A
MQREFVGEMERMWINHRSFPCISNEQKLQIRTTLNRGLLPKYTIFTPAFARVGEAYSYNTGKKMVKWSEEEIVENIFRKRKKK